MPSHQLIDTFASFLIHWQTTRDLSMDQQKNSSWLTWCREHRSWLAAHFLEQVDSGEPVRPFFGSWFDVQGRKMTGYYLGHELIADLHERMGLKEIAAMQQVSQLLRPMVEEMAVS